VALIAYTAPGDVRCVASGLFVDGCRVLTADHVAEGTGHRVEFPGGSRHVVAVIRSGSVDVDLAVLTVNEPVEALTPLKCAQVDRGRVARLSGCVAVGFPRWRRDGGERRSAQVNGWMPTAEGLETTADSGLRAGFLTLIGDRIPGAPPIPAGTLIGAQPNPWGGMSGAAVVVDGLLVGVVRSHNLASGGQSLTVTPLTAIGQLPRELQHTFWKALGVADPGLLPTLPDDISQVPRRDSHDPAGQNDNLPRIHEYLNAARILAEQHPYALALQGVPDLPTVYLHQKVSPQSGQAQRDLEALESVESPRPHPSDIHVTERQHRLLLTRAADQSAIRIAEVLQLLDVQDILTQHRGAMLLGGPGAGKSSLLRYLLHESSTVWLAQRNQVFIPVLVQARAMVGDRSFPKAIAWAVMADLGPLLSDSDLAEIFANQPIPGIPWLVLLDGVDEILDREDRKRVLITIARWWDDPRYRFLVTSRMLSPAEFYPLDSVNAPVFEIQQFNEDELPGFAERWFTELGLSNVPHLVDNLLAQLIQSRLMQLARNPLIATIICVIFASDPERNLPHSRADLYEQFLALLMDKAIYQLHELGRLQDRLKPYGSSSQDAIDSILAQSRRLMESLASGRLATPTKESLIDHAEILTEPTRPQNVPVSVWRGVLEEVLRQSGVIFERGNDFVFVHHTLMEYLAACALASKAPSWLDKYKLRIAAGRGESLALFTVSVMHRNGIDLIGGTPRVLTIRKLVHARLVASLAYEGLPLPSRTVDVARERLTSLAAQRHNFMPDVVRDHVWDYEDDCVLAAKSLILLDKESGLVALARAALDPTVGGFNMYGYNELLDLDREHGLSILTGLASSSEIEGSDRVAVARFVLGENRDLGLQAAERLSLDPSVETVFRTEMGFKLLELDSDRGVPVLTRLVADPLMEHDRTECESRLAEVDRGLCTAAMAELIANSEAKLLDRFGTVMRLMTLDRRMALRTLESLAADPQNSGFVRARAAVALSEESPSAGRRTLQALARDERAPGFYRVFCLEWSWQASGDKDRLFDLLTLASERGLAGRWRVFAAEQLAGIDPELGLRALAKIRADVTVRRVWRLRARASEAILQRKPTHWL
jgi:Trypsin-like peptidase domain